MKTLSFSSIATLVLNVALAASVTAQQPSSQIERLPSPEVQRLPSPDGEAAEFLDWEETMDIDDLSLYNSPRAPRRRWSTAVDAIFLRRARADSLPLITNQATGQTVLDASQFEFHYEISPRITVIGSDGSDTSLEFRYFGIYDWNTFEARTGNLAFRGPGFTLGVNPASFGATYRSRMHNVEFNLLKQLSPSTRLRAGLRYINFQDRLLVQEFNVPTGTVVDIRAQNHWYGIHAGGDKILLNICDRLRIDGVFGVGLYGSHSHQTTSSGFLVPPVADRTNDIAFHVETGLAGMVRITECAVLRFGYQFMWMTGLALAPEQIASTSLGASTARIRTSGDLLLNGAHLGLEIVW